MKETSKLRSQLEGLRRILGPQKGEAKGIKGVDEPTVKWQSISVTAELASVVFKTDAHALTIPPYTYPYTPYYVVVWLPSYPTSAPNPTVVPIPSSRPVHASSTNWERIPYPTYNPPRFSHPRYAPHGPTSRTYNRNFMDTYYGAPPPPYPTANSYAYPTYPFSWTQGQEYAQWR